MTHKDIIVVVVKDLSIADENEVLPGEFLRDVTFHRRCIYAVGVCCVRQEIFSGCARFLSIKYITRFVCSGGNLESRGEALAVPLGLKPSAHPSSARQYETAITGKKKRGLLITLRAVILLVFFF